jgi:uncharacterized NAD(P)/FAD-binding protein YdhS
MPRQIAIVGAGFSGTVLAAHLLRQLTAPIGIHLFERSAVMGRGIAYAVRDWPYLLNVPAGRLSADSQDPMQFLRFAKRFLPGADMESFLPRELYGDYLEEVLRRAEVDASPLVRLTRTCAEVTNIGRTDGELELTIANGSRLVADQVILAVGDPPPPILPWARSVHDHPAYYADPWTHPRAIGAEKTVVIVGNGLTMADVALSLGHDVTRAPQLISISRHGLLPLPQSTFQPGAVQEDVGESLTSARSIRDLLAAVRKMAGDLAAQGGDWREVLAFVRHWVPTLWQRLPDVERRRFLRHVRCYWDIHRHRLPSQLSSRLHTLRDSGKLEVTAGRIVDIQANGPRLRVTWRCRGSQPIRTVEADAVVNATGSRYSVRHTPDPLLRSLRDAGLICEDELDLGLRTTLNGACLNADGTVSEALYYLGPMLRAGHWEATAATELRDHAERMARHLAEC